MALRLSSLSKHLEEIGLTRLQQWSERFTIGWLARVESTNTALKALAQAGAPDGFCLCADEQTAGRGQYGRTWHSPAGKGLYLSLLFRPLQLSPEQIPYVTTFAGIMVYRTLADLIGGPARLAVKEPNDILLDGCKVAGILVEADWRDGQPHFLVVGIGVNIGQDSFPEGLRQPATSLRLALGETAPTREAILAGLLGKFQQHWENFLADPVGTVVDYRSHIQFLPRPSHHHGETPY